MANQIHNPTSSKMRKCVYIIGIISLVLVILLQVFAATQGQPYYSKGELIYRASEWERYQAYEDYPLYRTGVVFHWSIASIKLLLTLAVCTFVMKGRPKVGIVFVVASLLVEIAYEARFYSSAWLHIPERIIGPFLHNALPLFILLFLLCLYCLGRKNGKIRNGMPWLIVMSIVGLAGLLLFLAPLEVYVHARSFMREGIIEMLKFSPAVVLPLLTFFAITPNMKQETKLASAEKAQRRTEGNYIEAYKQMLRK